MQIPDSKIAVTLYNLREYCKTESDLAETLEKVAGMGYKAVQVSGVPLPADVIRKYLDENPEVSAEIEALVREKAQAAKDGEDEFEGDEDGLDIRLMDDEDEEGQLDLEGLGGDDE